MRLTEPLIHSLFYVNLDATGGQHTADLINLNRVTPGGAVMNFQLWAYPPGGIFLSSYQGFPWEARIVVPGGGLLSCSNDAIDEAPDCDYPNDVLISSDEIQPWTEHADFEFFVKFPGDKYGKVNLSIVVARDPFVNIDAYYNPSGSRHLEIDPQA